MKKQQDTWRYSLRWSLPHVPCPGDSVLVVREVPAGTPCPDEVSRLWRPGKGYAITIDFLTNRPIRRWSKEAKAKVRRNNLKRRLNRKVSLFAKMFEEAKLNHRPSYFNGQ